MLEVAEIKALVIYLFTYKNFKKGYKKGLWQLRAFFFILLFLTIIKYSFSSKKVISKSWLEKRHYQHKRFCFFIEFHVALQSKDADSLSFEVAETKTLVIYLLSYEALKIRYKKKDSDNCACFLFYFIHAMASNYY